MTSTIGLHVAIYNDPTSVFRHWGVFIDGPAKYSKVVLQIQGFSQNFLFEGTFSNARESGRLAELIHLCDVPLSKFDAINEAAVEETIHNEFAGYNCQDYVLDLLSTLEKRGLVNQNAKYNSQKALVASKQEGLE